MMSSTLERLWNYPRYPRKDVICKGNMMNFKRKDVICGVCEKKYSVLEHVSILYTCETCKKKEEKMVVDMTEKQRCVIEVLEQNVDLPTKKIMQEVSDMWEGRITVSERYVQRIRKWFKANYTKNVNVKETDMKDVKDVKDALHDWQIDLINAANEGMHTVQELGRKFNIQDHQVRNTLKTFDTLVTSYVMDEDKSNVYFDPKNTSIISGKHKRDRQ